MVRARTLALAVLTLVALAPAAATADAPHYSIEEGVSLGREMEAVLARIADEYHRHTGRDLVVTSGTRSTREQAEAMYDKLRYGQRLTRLYQDYDAALEIQNAYRASQRRGRDACVEAMRRIIDAQVARGLFISRHLRASAADVRSRDMNRRERRIFERAVARIPNVWLLAEGTPPHFHLQLR